MTTEATEPTKKPATARSPRKRAVAPVTAVAPGGAAPEAGAPGAKAKRRRVTRTRAGAADAALAQDGAPRPASNGVRHLVVVESPAKAKTVGRYLGSDYTVKASMGHVRDLPEGKMGVDFEHEFNPQYVVMPEKKKIIAALKAAAVGVETIHLATDPDREGEAIAWHLREATGWHAIPVRRVVFHEITPEAIREAFQHDRGIDMRLVMAQQARRILDRLVGYQLSPLLWRKVQRGLSAGRVQSVALRLVVERDRQIEVFTPVEYWSVGAALQPEAGPTFTAELQGLAGQKEKLALPDRATVDGVLAQLEGARYAVGGVTTREVRRRPAPPFITSTLQQEAYRQLRFSPRKTMAVAQRLYEGMSLGTEAPVGLITYMRTDSPQVAESALREAHAYIQRRWGEAFTPGPRRYTSRSKVAQEAHEAIRPTSVTREPEQVRAHLNAEQYRLYELIWKRLVASQMTDAILDMTQVDVRATTPGGTVFMFRATGSVVKFAGFRILYMEARDEAATPEDDERERSLPRLQDGQPLTCDAVTPQQHFTEPPPHFTEATLIKALEERSIGRPSTYAPIISTLTDRQYAERERGRLKSTQLGRVVADQLVAHFPKVMDPDFTANMEEELDDVANGEREWVPVLKEFYGPFEEALAKAAEAMPRVRVIEETDEKCEKCGRPMVIRSGRFGKFISCSGFPECRNAKPLLKKTNVLCPKCGGDMVERKWKGRTFYGCSNYPTCEFTVNSRPLAEPCPECAGLLVAFGRGQARCTNCAYRGAAPSAEREGAAREPANVGA